MRVRTIADVKSSTSTLLHRITLRGSVWHCSCMAHYMAEDKRKPCKHIKAVQTLNNVAEGQMVQKRVLLTNEGEKILGRWRKRHNLPLVRPAGWKPSRKKTTKATNKKNL